MSQESLYALFQNTRNQRRRAFVGLCAILVLSSLCAAELTVSPSTVNFGTVPVGSSVSQSVTLTNARGATVKISQLVASGAGFSVSGLATPVELSAHHSVSFTVVFAPQASGGVSGTVQIQSNAIDSKLHMNLSGTGQGQVKVTTAPTLFGLNLNPEVISGKVPWPTFSFGAIRLWNSGTTWADLEPTNGVYNWGQLDSWLDRGQSAGVTSFVYTFGKGTPSWISSNPNDTVCNKDGNPMTTGQCDPPKDVNSGDQSFKAFVTALVQHAAGKISAYECINEPDVPEQWTGTMAQTLTMCTDMYQIVKANDPAALVTTPAPVAYTGQSVGSWMTSYLQSGGGKYADIVAFHGYQGLKLAQNPETINTIVQAVVSAVNSTSSSSKPIWDTEMSWDGNTNLPDQDLQAAFVASVYLLQWSQGVSRFYWFQYGAYNIGTLWTSTGGDNEAATAYGVVYGWLVGSTLTQPCSANGNVWTCGFTRSNGAQALAVWDSSQTCKNGSCTSSSYTTSSAYNQYVDLTGNVHAITPGSTIQIGAKPILLEN